MQVFMTGATGWVGRHVVEELIGAGHTIAALVRSEEKARTLKAKGIDVLLGTLDDVDILKAAAGRADAVAHLAFGQDYANFAELAAQDRRTVEVLGAALEGSDKPLLVTSGVALLAPGGTATEADRPDPSGPRQTEAAAQELVARGVRVAAVRFAPSVHGVGETHGFVPILIDLARQHGVSAYVGDGANRWPAVHVTDAARVYRLALEHGAVEPVYHAVGEEGVSFRAIAEAIGRKLGLPAEPREPEHFGWFSAFAAGDIPASSARTREALGWNPSGPALLEDIANPEYYNGNRP